MSKVWMIRGEGGRLYEDFRDRSVVAIGWSELAEKARPGMSRKELTDLLAALSPGRKPGSIIAGASQVWRFINEVEQGDSVVTYSPSNRTYLFGDVIGPYEHRPEWQDDGLPMVRAVKWRSGEIDRDSLSAATRNSLGSTLTVFLLPDSAAAEVRAAASGKPTGGQLPKPSIDEDPFDPLEGVETLAIERIKDSLSRLEWDDMQELVAGLLRAMGYRTQVSPAGPDRGKDIIASPDGFGFENPRIVVEVKHRKGAMGSAEIRSFLGGRHKDDRGLYVSTGGFTKDAFYEAERATVPLSLWTLDNVVRALVEHYEKTDAETKRLVPLKRIYVPA